MSELLLTFLGVPYPTLSQQQVLLQLPVPLKSASHLLTNAFVKEK